MDEEPVKWGDIVGMLLEVPWRTRVRIPKDVLPHPTAIGLAPSTGSAEGQLEDYRYLLPGGSGFHVKVFADHYEAHLDEFHPDCSDEDRRERAPKPDPAATGAAVGAVVGGIAGGPVLALTGAAVGAAVGAALRRPEEAPGPNALDGSDALVVEALEDEPERE